MTFNIGVIVGPILGGILADPAGSYPNVFGKFSFFVKFPYATPNMVSSVFLLAAGLAVWFGLEETLDSLRELGPDRGLKTGRWLSRIAWGRFQNSSRGQYSSVPSKDVEMMSVIKTDKKSAKRYTKKLPFRRIFTRNVVITLCSHFLLALSVGTFNSLWFVYLSTPVYDPNKSRNKVELPFHFGGGLGLKPRYVGFAMAILGVIGINMQLFLYPNLSWRLGTIKSWRLALLCFPVTYFLVPYLSVVPSSTAPPSAKTGVLIWLAICGVLFIQVVGRTFALPGQTILVNNCSPHPSVLGTVHGLAQSASSAARTMGPMLGGLIYGFGLNRGFVGTVWWILSVVAIVSCLASLLVREGDGHEIWLEGDEEDP